MAFHSCRKILRQVSLNTGHLPYLYWPVRTISVTNQLMNMYWGWLWGPGWPVPGWVQKQRLALIDPMLCSEMSCSWLPSFSPIPPLIQASGPHFQLMAQYFGSNRLFISNTNPQNHIPPNKSAHFCFYKPQHHLSSYLSTRTWSALWCPFPASVPPAQLTLLLPSLSL